MISSTNKTSQSDSSISEADDSIPFPKHLARHLLDELWAISNRLKAYISSEEGLLETHHYRFLVATQKITEDVKIKIELHIKDHAQE